MKKKNQEEPATAATEAPDKKEADKTRNVYLFGRVENEVALPVVKKLLKLNKSDSKKPINLYINSSGGNGYNADAIIATMHSIEAKVNAICLGHALSGACEILASATGERSAYEFATIMFHQTLWEADGDITNLEIQAQQGQRFREAQVELLSRCTGQDKRTIRTAIERDHYLSAREALEYGLIDRVIAHKGGSGKTPKHQRGASSQPTHLDGAESIAAKVNGKRSKGAKLAKKVATAKSSGRRGIK
jgi:ATP-dependent Clp protease protease subunit